MGKIQRAKVVKSSTDSSVCLRLSLNEILISAVRQYKLLHLNKDHTFILLPIPSYYTYMYTY